MKYLEKYKSFEAILFSEQIPDDSDFETIFDILLDLEDKYWKIISSTDGTKTILARDRTDNRGLPWSYLKDYVLRVKDFLGDNFISFHYRKNTGQTYQKIPNIYIDQTKKEKVTPMYEITELNQDTDISGLIWAFVIKFK